MCSGMQSRKTNQLKKKRKLTHTSILKMKRTWEFDGENQRKVPRFNCVGDYERTFKLECRKKNEGFCVLI